MNKPTDKLHLNSNLFSKKVEMAPTRKGFGEGLLEAGKRNDNVVALCADLTESTKMNLFAEEFPNRFVEIGVAEQNLATVASGMAAMGKVPFISSYAAFSPGRNYEQIRTTIALNDANVKIAGSHAGISVGPDGATHQMLEDIALMRVLPNMKVIVPCDVLEARKATLEIAAHKGPAYLRLARADSPILTSEETPFILGKAWVYHPGEDVTIIACGGVVYEALAAAKELAKHGVSAEVINNSSIKPLDHITLLASVRKTNRVITVEEHQVNGGLGGAVAELLSENHPVPLRRIGMQDRFGESGEPEELLDHFGLSAPHIVKVAETLVREGQNR